MVDMFPTAINDNSEGKNLVLSAVQNRQSHVLQLLLKKKFVKRKLIHEVDMSENNALHLAAEMGKQKPWLIPGAALQMQWEIKWYEVWAQNQLWAQILLKNLPRDLTTYMHEIKKCNIYSTS